MPVEVRWNQGEIYALLYSPSGEVFLDLRRRATRVLNAARRIVQVDTGTLKNSLHLEERPGRQPMIRIGSSMPYARYAHDGTGVYAGRGMIYPKRGRYLVWEQNGQTIFARKVRGMPGTKYLERALPAAAG